MMAIRIWNKKETQRVIRSLKKEGGYTIIKNTDSGTYKTVEKREDGSPVFTATDIGSRYIINYQDKLFIN